MFFCKRPSPDKTVPAALYHFHFIYRYINMKPITHPKERERAVHVLSATFARNKSVLQLTGPGPAPEKIGRLMRFALEECLEFGKVLTDDAGKTFALVIFPDQQRLSFSAFRRLFYFLFRIAGLRRIFSILAKEHQLAQTKKAHFGSSPQYYLWFLGVDPANQGQGHGTALLKELLGDARRMKRKLVLETSTDANLSFYWRAGLECYETIESGFPLYCFRAED